MTVEQIINIITDLNTFVIKDKATDEILYDEMYDGNIDEFDRIKDLKGLEVVGVSSRSLEDINIYVQATKHYSTWLDVTYSMKIEVDVPISEDVNAAFEKIGKEKLGLVPKSIVLANGTLSFDSDNMEYGTFYDCIEEA